MADKQITVGVDVKATGDAAKQMQVMAQEARKAEESLARLRQEQTKGGQASKDAATIQQTTTRQQQEQVRQQIAAVQQLTKAQQDLARAQQQAAQQQIANQTQLARQQQQAYQQASQMARSSPVGAAFVASAMASAQPQGSSSTSSSIAPAVAMMAMAQRPGAALGQATANTATHQTTMHTPSPMAAQLAAAQQAAMEEERRLRGSARATQVMARPETHLARPAETMLQRQPRVMTRKGVLASMTDEQRAGIDKGTFQDPYGVQIVGLPSRQTGVADSSGLPTTAGPSLPGAAFGERKRSVVQIPERDRPTRFAPMTPPGGMPDMRSDSEKRAQMPMIGQVDEERGSLWSRMKKMPGKLWAKGKEEFGTAGAVAVGAGMLAATPIPIPGLTPAVPFAARAIRDWWRGPKKEYSKDEPAFLQHQAKYAAQAAEGQKGQWSDPWATPGSPSMPIPLTNKDLVGGQSTKAVAQNMTQLADATKAQTQSTTQLTQAQQQATNAAKQQARGNIINPSANPGQQQGGGMMGFALKAWALNAGAQHMMGSATSISNSMQDPMLNANQKGREIAESLPVVGGLVKSFNELKDSVSGATAKLKAMQLATERHAAEQGIKQAAYMQMLPVKAQRAELSGRVQGNVENPELHFTPPDRDTLSGERGYRSAERRLPISLEKRQAEIELATRRNVDDGLDSEIADKRRESGKQRQAVDKANEFANKPGLSKKEGASRRLAEQQALLTLQKTEAELAALLEKKQQSVSGVLQAQNAVKQAGIALSREELTTLGEREQRVRGSAQQWGGLNEAEKVGALQASNRAKTQGYAALSPEEKALLDRAGGGEYAAKEKEKLALKDDGFKNFRKNIGEEADLRGIQKQQVKLKNEIEVQVQTDAAKLAVEIKDAMAPVLQQIEDAIKRQIKDSMHGFNIGQLIRRLTS